MDSEYDKLRFKKHPSLKKPGCWDEDLVRPRAQVMADARRMGKTVHFGNIFGICVEKGSELPKGHKDRKYKGRYVFRGNDVKDQNWETAMFQELGSSPAAMEASKSADFYGSLPGHASEQADADQAYTQALMEGTETWVTLPRERWPAGCEGIHAPVVPLYLALYGHPHAGTFWENHCEEKVQEAGFVRITDWRSCYWHPVLKLFLVIYVDDFKLSGPAENLAAGWKLLRKDINLGEIGPLGQFLGCNHVESTKTSPWTGNQVRTMEYDRESFLVKCVEDYIWSFRGPPCSKRRRPLSLRMLTPTRQYTQKLSLRGAKPRHPRENSSILLRACS